MKCESAQTMLRKHEKQIPLHISKQRSPDDPERDGSDQRLGFRRAI
jgi:hypothetical protein